MEPATSTDPTSEDAPGATSLEVVPQESAAPRDSLPRPVFRWRAVLSVVGIVTGLYLTGLSVQDSTFLKLTPGPAPEITANTSGEIMDPEYGQHGEIHFTTVQLDTVSWLEYLRLRALPVEHTSLVPADEVRTGSAEESSAAARVLMEESKAIAYALASSSVSGATVAEGDGARIVSLEAGSPADLSGVELGDIVVSVDGTPVRSAEALVSALPPTSGSIVLQVLRSGEVVDVSVSLAAPQEDTPRLGAQIGTEILLEPALDVDTSGVGGPSGGLMFTLAFMDALSTGDLTGDQDLAGTGTIALDGTVGPIGGIANKVVGAKREGATVFFSPAANYDDAVAAGVEGIEIVRVETYTDALEWLCENGASSSACG